MKIFNLKNIILFSSLIISNNIGINCKPTLNSYVYNLSSENYDYYHEISKNGNSPEKEIYLDLDLISNKTTENEKNILYKRSDIELQSVKFIKYEETLSVVANPYIGFYEQGFILLKVNSNDTNSFIPLSNLVRLLIDISDFQNNNLNEDAINYLISVFEKLKENHQTVVVRFAYHRDFNGDNKTNEPDITKVLEHLDQVKSILNFYDDIIASVECGLFGIYGEMFQSDVTDIQNSKRSFISNSIKKWLEILNESITVSVRTPEQYINFYEDILNIKISDISKHKSSSGEPGYRIGIFNDAYFSSSDDIGTYKNRDNEIEWISNQATHALFGGEFGNYTNQFMGDIKIDGKQISTEAFKTHTSYLNSRFYEDALSILRSRKCTDFFGNYEGQTELKYIENHLGYRYVVRSVRLTTEAESNGIFGAEISIENVGFANLIKQKSIYVIMTDNNDRRYDLTNSLKITNSDPRQWWSKNTTVIHIEGILPNGMKNGNYKLYLRIASNSNGGLNGNPIKFANDDQNIWNESLGANYLGDFAIVGHNENPLEAIPVVYSQENMEPFNSKYPTLKFKGNLSYTENYYLGVPELKEIDNFNIYELTNAQSAKYRTWHVESKIKPSLLYLSNGVYGNMGEPSDYCLDLGTFTDGNGYNFLSIVKCSNAKHKFMYGKSFSNSIDVYDLNDNHLTDSDKNDLCLFYSMTPKLDKCSLSSSEENMSWNKYNVDLKYTTVKYKGMLNNDSNQYLGVPELKEYTKISISNGKDSTSAKYRTWHISSDETPSLLYLSTGTFGNIGEPTNYCLDLSISLNGQGYNYLSVVECSKAQHKFLYGKTLNNTIDVYTKNGNRLKDKKGNYLCLYYSMTPSIDKCNNSQNDENMHWDKYVLTATYTPIRFKGISTNHYLGVPELKEYNNFNIYELNNIESTKYRTWYVVSDNAPSFLYLSDGTFYDNGKPTNYCLDISTYLNDQDYNYLSVVECSKAQHKFLYGESLDNSIDVYKKDGNHLTDKNGDYLCIYYAMTPSINKCRNLDNNINMRWDEFIPTATYIPMRFKGTLNNAVNYFLGVPELKEHNNFNIYELNDTESAKYHTWHVTSINAPSFLYLSDGANDDIGEPTNYCLDLGTYTNGKGYNYLSVVDCSKAQHKFMFGDSLVDSIDVYKMNGDHLTDKDGDNVCLLYSMTPSIDKCKNSENEINMHWDKSSLTTNSIPIRFKGALSYTTNYYLGVPELKEHNNFNIYELNDIESAKYHTWHVSSINIPSLLYLSDGANDAIGEPTNYCLDLGTYTNGKGYNFLGVVNCSKAQHKFLYGGSYSNSIEVYTMDGNPLTNDNGVNLCLYYSMTPSLDECNLTIENMKWNKFIPSINYTPVRFKGTLTGTTNYYLGVPELKEHNNFNIYKLNDVESAKYHTWHIVSDNSPSFLYLSNGANDAIGKPTNYCLDLGTFTNNKGYNYLSVVDCSKAQHKFMFGESLVDSLDVYKINGNHLVDANGDNLCLFYSMTPSIDKCNNIEDAMNMHWDKYTPAATYTPERFKGTLKDTRNYYLGVPELKEYDSFNIHELNDINSAKYHTWYLFSNDSPSLFYLSDGANDDIGEPTNYCLDLSISTNDQGYNYLSVIRCSKAQHKFMFGKLLENSIDIYKNNGDHLTDKDGNYLCLYYSMTPSVDKCNNLESDINMRWDKYTPTATYTHIRFKGTLKNTINYYLGVPELKEYYNLNIYKLNDKESAKYHTWQVTSINSPSLLYLSDGAYNDNGKLTNYCLDLSTYTNSQGYNYLSVVYCSKAQHKFMFGESLENSIDVYRKNGDHLKDKDGNDLCLYYSMTPSVDKCNKLEEESNMHWNKFTPTVTYTPIRFKGALTYTTNYYLGVPELKERDNFNIYELNDVDSAKYHTWHVISDDNAPSLLYLSDGANEEIGEPTNYCLDLGTYTNGKGYNYLSVVRCSKAQHKFKFGASLVDSIDVYMNNGDHLVDKDGNNLCLFYSMTPSIDKCNNLEESMYMHWNKYTPSQTYTPLRFKGTLKNTINYYLGVPELKEYGNFNIYELNDMESAKYRTWHVLSVTSPSLLYLSDGANEAVGEPTNYCLDLGYYTNSQGYNYLSVVYCSEAQHKFKIGESFENSIDVYGKNGDHLKDKDGNDLCLYYSMTPSVDKCRHSGNDDVNMHWDNYIFKVTYTPLRFKGTLEYAPNYYLGVPELKEHHNFNIYEINDTESAKYHTWQVTSVKYPSFWYLSDGANDDIGKPTNYCLDLGTYTNGKGYNFLSVVNCAKVQHKFMFGESLENSIDVYKKNGDHLKDKNGDDVCLYYSMTPGIDKCKNSENDMNMRWEKATLTTNSISLRFKGTLTGTPNYYLGVKELKEHDNFNIYDLNDIESAKYHTWHVLSDKSPSLLYLSDGANDDIGEPSNYCLDLGTYTNGKGYNFLSVVDCSRAQHKFMYGGSYSNSIEVYNANGDPLTNENGVNLCLYYSMTPCLDECNLTIENMKWDKYQLSTTYTPVKFKGTLSGITNYFLGVKELKEHNNFNIYELSDTESGKYHTWFVTSDNSPSLLYLSDGVNDTVGEPTNYCLDLGTYTNGKGYNFLSVVDCSKAQHKFMYGGSYSNSIEVYNANGNPLTNENGVNLCLYYSMTPCLDECNLTIENMKWDKY